jgi:peptidoglycan/LPS O-acetylase OafA/YrhL
MKKSSLQNEFESLGWTLTNSSFDAPIDFKSEVKFWIIRVLVDLIAIIPFSVLLYVYFESRIFRRGNNNKILLGTHPLINYKGDFFAI